MKYKLGDVCESMVRGPFGSALKKEFFVEKADNTYKVYEQGNAIRKDVNYGNYYVNQEKYLELKRFEVLPMDFIMSCSGTIGELYQIPLNAEKGIINQALLKMTIDNQIVDNKYFKYIFRYNIKKLESKGSGIQNVASVKVLKDIEFEIPTLNEQYQIVKLLDSVYEIINYRRVQYEKLDNLIKARFVELFGDPIVNSMSWAEELIGDSCFVTKLAGFEYTQYIHYEDSGDVVMVKAQNVKNGKLNRKDLSYIANEVSDSLPRSQLAAGDVVMTYVGANIGDVAIIDDEYKYHLAPNVAKIRPDSEKFNSIYLMYMLMFLNSYIVGNSADTAKAALGMERIRKLKVFVPPITLQERFATFVAQVDKSKVAVQEALNEAQLLFDSLMQKYFG